MTKYEALNSLDERAASKLSLAIIKMENQNIPYFISETARPLLTQCLYVLQGTGIVPQSELEWACKLAGIRPPGTQRISWTLKSKHIEKLAVDMGALKEEADPKDPDKKRWIPDWSKQDMRIVEIMKGVGFIWGGDWSQKDDFHFELRV